MTNWISTTHTGGERESVCVEYRYRQTNLLAWSEILLICVLFNSDQKDLYKEIILTVFWSSKCNYRILNFCMCFNVFIVFMHSYGAYMNDFRCIRNLAELFSLPTYKEGKDQICACKWNRFRKTEQWSRFTISLNSVKPFHFVQFAPFEHHNSPYFNLNSHKNVT